MRILGISAFYHDSAAALLVDGRIAAAAQEERFTRKKQDAGFPAHAIAYCLDEAGCKLDDVDFAVFYEKPFLKFERLLETYVAFAPQGYRSFAMAIPLWIREKLFQKDVIRRELQKVSPDFDWQNRLLFTEHHISHAASAFYASPYAEAAVLTMDGVGEWCTASAAIGRGNDLQLVKEMHFPHSLGLLYSAFTYYVGFKVNSGEYKLMGLAPYGEPKYADRILEHLIDLKPDGSFRLDLSYFDYCTGLTMTNQKFADLFGAPVRDWTKELLTPFHMDVAASIQAVTEEVMLRLSRSLASEHGLDNLCLAGGVALNCVANGKILRDGAFKNIWVQPAAGDAGGALGAALAVWHQFLGRERVADNRHDLMEGALLGPGFAQADVESRLAQAGAHFAVVSEDDVIEKTATSLASGDAVGWMQGRMEFGPRALGARSVLGDPRSPSMQKTLNLRVKYRESFRPFAPAVLRENVADWFEIDADLPYMLLVADVKEQRRRRMSNEEEALFGIDKLNVARSEIPAVTHVDYSARIQTVHADTNPRFHALIARFRDKTGCPVLVNTSFNVRSEPIVCTPEDAFRCFMGNEIELLVVGNCMLRKAEQNPALKIDYKDEFEPDLSAARDAGAAAMKVIYFHEAGRPPDDLERMFGSFAQVKFVLVRKADDLAAALADAEILIVNNRSYTAANAKLIRDHGRALRWIQFSTSGIDNAQKHGLPDGVIITNMSGLRAFAVAEHALMLMLGLLRRLPVTERARKTDYRIRDDVTPSMQNLAGKNLVIIGLGEIGQEIARKAKAFDMTVTGVSRATEAMPNIDRLRPRSELVAACAEADIVAVAAMHDASTDKILSREAIAAMRPSAYVINIARGKLVDEPALIEALQAGRLAGAGLDVVATEPLPGGHPFWSMENVIMTPHVGGAGSAGVGGGLGSIFADNLRRWLDGKPLAKVVQAGSAATS